MAVGLTGSIIALVGLYLIALGAWGIHRGALTCEAVAEALAEIGCRVVCAGRRIDRLKAVARRLGRSPYAVQLDVTDQNSVDGLFDRLPRELHEIDILVNNAGVYISKPFTDYTAADYALITGVNLAGFLWITQRAIAEMAARHGGHVVNITATLAEVANSGEPAVLSALTKGGLAAATRSLAVEYASRGIRVNAVSPGIIQTPLHPAESYQDLGGRLPPLGRAGQVSDVVDAILFLESSPYITGEILHVDGGQTAGH